MADVANVAITTPSAQEDPILSIILTTFKRMVDPSSLRLELTPKVSQNWIRVSRRPTALPKQGWKLHISATVTSAQQVLREALPILLAGGVTFKVAASIDVLALLNHGEGSFSQIGKFITVYPEDDAQAVRLALELDQATYGLPGPAIPSDHCLRRGSLIYYRYGAFDSDYIRTSLGSVYPAISAPDGKLVVTGQVSDGMAS